MTDRKDKTSLLSEIELGLRNAQARRLAPRQFRALIACQVVLLIFCVVMLLEGGSGNYHLKYVFTGGLVAYIAYDWVMRKSTACKTWYEYITRRLNDYQPVNKCAFNYLKEQIANKGHLHYEDVEEWLISEKISLSENSSINFIDIGLHLNNSTLETIRFCSQTAEALIVYIGEFYNRCDNGKWAEIDLLHASTILMDRVEHIAQYSLANVSNRDCIDYLIRDIDCLNTVICDFGDLLKKTNKNLPQFAELNQLETKLKNLRELAY